MRSLIHFLCILSLWLVSDLAVADQPPQKIALLVGVSDYFDKDMEDLSFAEKDAKDLGYALRNMGFDVVEVVGKDANQQNVQKQIDGFLENASTVDSESVVFIMFSGHGQQLRVSKDSSSEEVPFYCPQDAIPFDSTIHTLRGKTADQVEREFKLVSLNRLIRDIDKKSNSLQNLLLVDACRNNPAKGKSAGITGSGARELPRGISILFAARSGQKSWESVDPEVKQGVMTHYLLKGIQGAAYNGRKEITWSRLVSYVQEEVEYAGWKLAGGRDRIQNPHAIINNDRTIVLDDPASIERRRSLDRGVVDPLSTGAALASIAKMDVGPGDWPMWGGWPGRNNTPQGVNIPDQWDIKTGQNIKWFADLGTSAYAPPVIANGRVFIGTNNKGGRLKRYPSNVDLGVLLCLDEQTGGLLWQYSAEKLGRVHDWPEQGIVSAPYADGDRIWFVDNRGCVVCADAEGFTDGIDDGGIREELGTFATIMNAGEDAAIYLETLEALNKGRLSNAARQRLAAAGETLDHSPDVGVIKAGEQWRLQGSFGGIFRTIKVQKIGPRLKFSRKIGIHDTKEADVVWRYDMMDELGVSHHNKATCSPVCVGDRLFVITGNGVDESHMNMPAPEAPSFICLDRNTGKLLWTHKGPGVNVLHGQWSSPAVIESPSQTQILFPGGDGWLYSFSPEGKFFWKFDCNPKTNRWVIGGEGTRNSFIALPVVYDGLVYIATGQDPEHGEGEGHLWCIDPNKRGDISPTLAMKIEGNSRVPIAHKRHQAVDPAKGELEIENPNSALVWHFSGVDDDGDGEIEFEEAYHRMLGAVVVHRGILFSMDLSGLLHCFDAKSGRRLGYYDAESDAWPSPLVVDGRIFQADEDWEVAIFDIPKAALRDPDRSVELEPKREIMMDSGIYATPVVANDTLYITSTYRLWAIQAGARMDPAKLRRDRK